MWKNGPIELNQVFKITNCWNKKKLKDMNNRFYVAEKHEVEWHRIGFWEDIDLFEATYNFINDKHKLNVSPIYWQNESELELSVEDFKIVKAKLDEYDSKEILHEDIKTYIKRLFGIHAIIDPDEPLKTYGDMQEVFNKIDNHFDQNNEYIIITYF